VVGVGVYQAGVISGLSEYAREPEETDRGFLLSQVQHWCKLNACGEVTALHGAPRLYRVFGEREKLDSSYMYNTLEFMHGVDDGDADADAEGDEAVCDATAIKPYKLRKLAHKGHAKILSRSMEVTQRVGVRLLDAARLLVDKEIYLQTNVVKTARALKAAKRGELQHAEHNLKENNLIEDTYTKAKAAHDQALSDYSSHTAILENDHFQKMEMPELKKARKLLEQTWEFCLLDSSEVNAFVHALQPRRIFVNVPLIVLTRTEDELAMVLAHEISHALCAHTESAQQLELYKAAAVAFLFSMVDPTGGIAAFLVDGVVWADASFDVLSMTFSREHEHEADTLGINIMSQACFNPENGINIMKRFTKLEHGIGLMDARKDLDETDDAMVETDIENAKGIRSSLGTLLRSHPPSAERVDNLQKMAPTLAAHYQRSCGQTEEQKTAFQKAYHPHQRPGSLVHPQAKATGGMQYSNETQGYFSWVGSGVSSMLGYDTTDGSSNEDLQTDQQFDAAVPHMKVTQRATIEIEDE